MAIGPIGFLSVPSNAVPLPRNGGLAESGHEVSPSKGTKGELLLRKEAWEALRVSQLLFPSALRVTKDAESMVAGSSSLGTLPGDS